MAQPTADPTHQAAVHFGCAPLDRTHAVAAPMQAPEKQYPKLLPCPKIRAVREASGRLLPSEPRSSAGLDRAGVDGSRSDGAHDPTPCLSCFPS